MLIYTSEKGVHNVKQVEIARQYMLEGGSMAITRLQFELPISELRQMVADAMVGCDECWEPVRKGGPASIDLDVWDGPFDDAPRTITVHHNRDGGCGTCSERIYDSSWSDFRYFDCEGCNRTICEQNPSNGWHAQYRIVDGEQICLKCYEDELMEHGVNRESIENGTLPGMFFSGGNPEPLAAGYEPHGDRFVSGDADAVCQEVLALMDSGRQVIIGYESMGIGGGEGTVSLHSKAIA